MIVRNGLFEIKTGPQAAVKTGALQCGDNWTESTMTATEFGRAVEIERLIVLFKVSVSAAKAYTQPSEMDELVCNLLRLRPSSP